MADYTTYTGSSGNVRNIDEYLTLGMFIQDPESAADPGTDKGALNSSFQAKLGAQLYGFRFLFNPPNISWSASVNNSVDWSMGNPNNAVIVGAGIGGQISFEILLDRVADMTVLKNFEGQGLGVPHYPWTLTAEQAKNLKYRGTEYDLEYLFRVVNGKPVPTTLLGRTGEVDFKLETSNMGYIAGTPFIFIVNDRLRYKVMLSSLRVTHTMFTREMIPIRSAVEIVLERLPDFGFNKNSQNIDKFTQVVLGSPAQQTGSGASSEPSRRVPPRGALVAE
jgi:hypothetical protein